MTEPRRFQSPTGRLEHKIPTMQDWGIRKRQMALYAEALLGDPSSRLISGALVEAEAAYVRRYSETDVAFNMSWWRRYIASQPVLINKLRGRDKVIYELNDIIHPETLEKMARPLPRATAYPDYGVAPVWLIV
jgi:hypothetical protein